MDATSIQSTRWSSKLIFIMASAGAAVGLGNIWRFPYITGENGGGAFVLIYLTCVLVLGIPLMMSEVLVGRRGRRNAAGSYQKLAKENGRSDWWWLAGLVPILAGFLILSYYSVIAGWVLDFLFQATRNTFHHITPKLTHHLFQQLMANPVQMLFWDTLVISATIIVISLGIHKGLEKTVYILLPTLLLIAVILIIYAIKNGSFMQGMAFLFVPDWSEVTPHSVLLALGQAFFSLGIGTGVMLTYGKYVTQNTSIAQTSMIIALCDTAVALIAGLTIFPIVFAQGLSPDAGPGLIFKTLPVAFGEMQFGAVFAILFFLMLELAAFTSAIALLEPMVVFCMEQFNWRRPRATFTAGFVNWLLSLLTIFSFNKAQHYTLFDLHFFALLDYFTSNIMLPLSGLLVALFCGWYLPKLLTRQEFGLKQQSQTFRYSLFSIRYIAPLAILLIFLNALHVF